MILSLKLFACKSHANSFKIHMDTSAYLRRCGGGFVLIRKKDEELKHGFAFGGHLLQILSQGRASGGGNA